MTSTKKDPVIVVLQLTGGNDYFNTVIPYNDPLYVDNRPAVHYEQDQIIKIDDQLGFMPTMGPVKDLYDQGKVAVFHGVGYPDSPRSHFRSMDIWHTCEPDKVGIEGWAGRVARELDPNKENIVTTVSFGYSLFRALVSPGVPVACVDNLDSYGLLTDIGVQEERTKILDRFARMYAPAVGNDMVMDYLGQTGLEAMAGADILKVAHQNYASSVEYAETSISQKLKGIAKVHLAGLGTRIFYCDQAGFDTHANQLGTHATLWKDVSEGIVDFFSDLQEHNAADNVIMLLFTEFGRRAKDNGSGTDHGSGGAAFAIGDAVKGGQYGEYPSIKLEDLQHGDLVPNLDFRGLYSTVLEDWLGLDAKPIVKGTFEKPRFL